MRREQISAAVAALDVREVESQEMAWAQLRPLGFGVVPYLLDAYSTFRTWQGRCALMYYSTRYSRQSPSALGLGLLGLSDRSYMVRYRACGLLAYALNKEAVPALEQLAECEGRDLVLTSAKAAMNAIKAGNHNLFVDQRLSGQSSWTVNPGDAQQPVPSRVKRLMLGIQSVN
ncbi:hypothetical protein GCM10023115_07230 [Pontixanthobacter gangjinensis]|uniref:HEAT repeat domain-containing protein n=1 Tax=Pontixanthobacter gangjinensis TaxID=1028742 RepID=A0A6I4SLG3_9SPHN|nr:hypothetical protein [Pontixanthobacter gangjinensis]MXO55970.1 hypothetical protein [Pontixanthobacter gangjinensis]